MNAARYPDVVGLEPPRRYAHDLAALADDGPLTTRVPTCGDWTLADLVWHLMEVQHFWGYIIKNRPAGPEQYPVPTRPSDDALAAGLRGASETLASALTGADPDEPAWSWSDDHSVAFTLRRQTHEAFVHLVDGLLALGRAVPAIDERLAADGIDEIVTVMLPDVREGADFDRTDGVIELRSSDTGDSWSMGFGRLTGTSPDDSESYDLDAVAVVHDEPADTIISAPAVDLYLWLWGRRDSGGFDLTGRSDLGAKLRNIAIGNTA